MLTSSEVSASAAEIADSTASDALVLLLFFLVSSRYLDAETLGKIKKLNDIARAGGMTLAQMALAWILRRPEVTSVLVGASSTAQLDSSLAALKLPPLGEDVRKEIRAALGQ